LHEIAALAIELTPAQEANDYVNKIERGQRIGFARLLNDAAGGGGRFLSCLEVEHLPLPTVRLFSVQVDDN
jgi:hypothetical protein